MSNVKRKRRLKEKGVVIEWGQENDGYLKEEVGDSIINGRRVRYYIS